MDLDETDRRILGELQRDGRTSMSALAESVHISRANA
jgi:DNA-binding Lrp family transcriptional regulator